MTLPSPRSFKNCLSSLHCCFTADGAGSRQQIQSSAPFKIYYQHTCGQIQTFPSSAVPPAPISVSPSSLLPECHGTAYLPLSATCHPAPKHSNNKIFFLRSFSALVLPSSTDSQSPSKSEAVCKAKIISVTMLLLFSGTFCSPLSFLFQGEGRVGAERDYSLFPGEG